MRTMAILNYVRTEDKVRRTRKRRKEAVVGEIIANSQAIIVSSAICSRTSMMEM